MHPRLVGDRNHIARKPTKENIRCQLLGGTAKWDGEAEESPRSTAPWRMPQQEGVAGFLFLQLEDKRESPRTLPGLLLVERLRMKKKSRSMEDMTQGKV